MANFKTEPVIFWIAVLAGLGLFLYGICSLSNVLKKMAGPKLKKFLSKCANNPFKGLLIGCGFTTVIQSSSGTTALTVGLVRAGILTFVEAAAIIIGANIGTTITAFIISIPVIKYLPILIFIGSLILLLISKKRWQNIGEICFALGSIFLGLWIIDLNLKTLGEEPWLIETFKTLNTMPWLGLLVGTLAATVFQSSSAVIGVLQGIYAASLVDPNTSLTLFGIVPIVLGANIGTTITAFISAIGGSKDAKRIAIFHAIFNVTGSLVFMGILYACKSFLINSPNWGLDGKLQIAIVHLIFNVATGIVFLPLLKPMNKLCRLIIRGEDSKHAAIVIKELDTKAMKEFPSAGIQLAKEQVDSMFGYVMDMFTNINAYLVKPNADDGNYVLELEESVDKIDRQLNEYLLLADKGDLTNEDTIMFSVVLRGCKDIERLGDYGENLINFYMHAHDKKVVISGKMLDNINRLQEMAESLLKMTYDAYTNTDKVKALDIIEVRREYVKQAEAMLSEYLDHIQDYEKDGKVTYLDLVFSDIVSDYQRVYSHCSNIAKLFNHDKTYS